MIPPAMYRTSERLEYLVMPIFPTARWLLWTGMPVLLLNCCCEVPSKGSLFAHKTKILGSSI